METAKNDALAAKNTAKGASDTADSDWQTEFDKIAALQATYDEKKGLSDEAREQWLVDNTAETMWGKPESSDGAGDAVEGVEEKLRKADKALN